MIELRTPQLVARVDPDRGGAIAGISAFGADDWLWSTDGVDLDRLAAEQLDEEGARSMQQWQVHSRGGWEVLAPNAGDRGVVGDRVYPFHGTAGRGAWTVDGQSDDQLAMTFVDDELGFRSRRVIAVRGTRCAVTESIESQADTPLPIAWGSHLAFGRTLIDGEFDLTLGGEPVAGSYEPGDTAAFAVRRRTGAPDAVLRNRGTGASATVTVEDRDGALPYLWVWAELGGTTGWPWFGTARALGLEPVSAPHPRGVADLPGADHVLHPGERRSATVEITLEMEGGTTP